MQKKKDYLKNLDLAYIDDDEKNTEKIGELLKKFFQKCIYI